MMTWLAQAHAGAWTKEVGSAYAKASAEVYGTPRLVAPDVEGGGTYVGQQHGLYGEVGVLRAWRTQLSVGLPVVGGTQTTTVSDGFGDERVRASTWRTGDLRAAAQVALHRTVPVSLALDLKVPTYQNGTVGRGYPVYAAVFPKPGDGQVDVGLMLYAGGVPWESGFVEGGVGYIHRTEAFVGWDTDLVVSDGFRFLAKIGHRLGHVLPILAVDGTLAPGSTDVTRQWVAVSGSALLDLGDHGFALEPRVMVEVWTRNASRGLAGGLGASWRR